MKKFICTVCGYIHEGDNSSRLEEYIEIKLIRSYNGRESSSASNNTR